ncbi:MAG: sigma-70 family RNA polymerase sigma factor [Firmicutes bacterium]|nr:sigma-70 family RNA polymerase sigma factor [[Eubacterium] siraeum]MCM1487979.1 sigma-70 family RNA polymerase sigma factor [Bacillota bacterium]
MNSAEILDTAFYCNSITDRNGEGSAKEGEILKDEEIIEMFFRRDENGIAAAEQKYGSYCIAVAKSILNNDQDAEEVAADTWYRAWETIPPERPRNLGGYLAKIAKNLSLNRYDKARTAKRGGGQIPLIYDELSDVLSKSESVERAVEQMEIASALNNFLSKLPSKKRNIFVLRYWYCLSISEIAAKTGDRENTVTVTLLRLRNKLCEYFKKEGLI